MAHHPSVIHAERFPVCPLCRSLLLLAQLLLLQSSFVSSAQKHFGTRATSQNAGELGSGHYRRLLAAGVQRVYLLRLISACNTDPICLSMLPQGAPPSQTTAAPGMQTTQVAAAARAAALGSARTPAKMHFARETSLVSQYTACWLGDTFAFTVLYHTVNTRTNLACYVCAEHAAYVLHTVLCSSLHRSEGQPSAQLQPAALRQPYLRTPQSQLHHILLGHHSLHICRQWQMCP
jgi:hypothetical protein